MDFCVCVCQREGKEEDKLLRAKQRPLAPPPLSYIHQSNYGMQRYVLILEGTKEDEEKELSLLNSTSKVQMTTLRTIAVTLRWLG